MCSRAKSRMVISPFSFNPALRSFPPSHLGNSSKLDCTRFGVGSPFSFPPCSNTLPTTSSSKNFPMK